MTPARRGRRASTALATAEELWGAHPVKQARSVDAVQRIAIAGQELFGLRNYDTVTVADIAAAAGISVGAFYTRFPGKEHLVVHLMRDLADEMMATMDRDMNPAMLANASVAEVVRRYLTMTADTFVRYRGLLRPATLIARQTTDPGLQDLLRRFNDTVHGRYRALLAERLGTSAGSNAEVIARIDIAILWSSAAMREVLLYGEPVSSLSRRHLSLVEELTRAMELYLRAERDA